MFGSPEVDALKLSYDRDGGTDVRGSGAGPPVSSRTASGVTLSFPGIEFVGQSAVVTSYVPGAPNLWAGADGQVSAVLFNHFIVDINFDTMRVGLTDPEHFHYEGGGQELPLRLESSGMWSIPATITLPHAPPVNSRLSLDLGNANPLQISAGGPHQFEVPEASFDASLGFGMQGEQHGWFGPVSHLALGGYQITDSFAAFDQFDPDTTFEEAMIGFELLSRFNLIFDYPDGRIFIEPNRYFTSHGQLDVSGMRLDHAGAGVVVTDVLPGSPAQRAGVQRGDQILGVNGAQLNDAGIWALGRRLSQTQAAVMLSLQREGQLLEVSVPTSLARFFVDSQKFVAHGAEGCE